VFPPALRDSDRFRHAFATAARKLDKHDPLSAMME
jgi:hypothetical protein